MTTSYREHASGSNIANVMVGWMTTSYRKHASGSNIANVIVGWMTTSYREHASGSNIVIVMVGWMTTSTLELNENRHGFLTTFKHCAIRQSFFGQNIFLKVNC